MHVLFVGSIFASVASSQRLLCITRSIILYKESKDFRRICFSIRKLCISTFFESYYITRKEHFPYDWCSVVNSNCSCSILSSVFSIILSVLWCYQCHVALQISIFFFFFFVRWRDFSSIYPCYNVSLYSELRILWIIRTFNILKNDGTPKRRTNLLRNVTLSLATVKIRTFRTRSATGVLIC